MTAADRLSSKLVVIGAGGHGREVVEALLAAEAAGGEPGDLGDLGDLGDPGDLGAPVAGPGRELIGVIADDVDPALLDALGTAHLGPVDEVERLVPAGTGYVVAIGSSQIRATLAGRLDDVGLVATSVIHPAASVGRAVRIGPGCYVAAGAGLTTNVELGRHVHVNVNAVVSHDCVVGDFATLSPGVLVNGTCRIGARSFLGTGAVVLPGRRIGADAVIGAGAVVVDDVEAGVTVVGVPARPMGRPTR